MNLNRSSNAAGTALVLDPLIGLFESNQAIGDFRYLAWTKLRSMSSSKTTGEMPVIDTQDVQKMSGSGSGNLKPYVVYLPEDQVSAAEKKRKTRNTALIILILLIISAAVFGWVLYKDNKDE